MNESSETSTELVVPGIGQVVNLEDPRETAFALNAIRDLEYQLKAIKTDLTRALAYASQQEGSKTLRYEGVEITIKSGPVRKFDAAAIYDGLLTAGMSPQRASEVVKHTVTQKVDAREADRASGANPAYRDVIETHTTFEEGPPSATVSIKTVQS